MFASEKINNRSVFGPYQGEPVLGKNGLLWKFWAVINGPLNIPVGKKRYFDWPLIFYTDFLYQSFLQHIFVFYTIFFSKIVFKI